MNPWFTGEDEESRHRGLLGDPADWPNGTLCLKHPGRVMAGEGIGESFATVYASAPLSVVTHAQELREYASVQEILDDGWVVD